MMKFPVNNSASRARGLCLGALLLSLLLGANFSQAQEAPRPEGSTPIKPPMIKPPMNRSQNANSGGVKTSSKRRKTTTRRRRRARKARTVREFVDTEIVDVPLAGGMPRRQRPISGGVLNGKAKTLPQPEYPAIAKNAHAAGTVVVQVIIDERGDVISARAVSGHRLLRQAAIDAARQAKFTPTLLSGQPLMVTGTLSYDFVP
jgi:TonB family protein